jgi:acetyl esterase/lipase
MGLRSLFALACVLVTAGRAPAGPLHDRLKANRATAVSLPPDVRLLRNVSYGDAPQQRFDVYAPELASGAPVLFMVHGGAWAFGDKADPGFVANKVMHWVSQGFVLVSVNYRMLPDADPLEQACDVARALAVAQKRAAEVGADKNKFVLLGHSAGAHLVSLLSASSVLTGSAGATPWLGTVSLDSAALDVPAIMMHSHAPLYDRAFGSDPAYWRSASPLQQLVADGPPILAVCSTLRSDSCSAADALARKASALGRRAMVLREALTHIEINERLGDNGAYTDGVESFLRSLDPAIAAALKQRYK